MKIITGYGTNLFIQVKLIFEVYIQFSINITNIKLSFVRIKMGLKYKFGISLLMSVLWQYYYTLEYYYIYEYLKKTGYLDHTILFYTVVTAQMIFSILLENFDYTEIIIQFYLDNIDL